MVGCAGHDSAFTLDACKGAIVLPVGDFIGTPTGLAADFASFWEDALPRPFPDRWIRHMAERHDIGLAQKSNGFCAVTLRRRFTIAAVIVRTAADLLHFCAAAVGLSEA